MEFLLDSHSHTVASGHAYNTIMEMAQAAAQKGLKLLALTEHSMRLPGACHEYYFQNLKVLPREMYGIEVLFGTEANIMDFEGQLDMEQTLLSKMDVVVASMHGPCITSGTEEENTIAYEKAMENPLVNIIGHPDDGRYPVDYDRLASAAKANHVLLELNNSSFHPMCSRVNVRNNAICMLRACEKYGTRIIVDSDSHCVWDVGRHDYAEELLKETGFPEELVINRSVEEYKKYINRYHKQ